MNYRRFYLVISLQLSILFVVQTAKTQDPFYIIAHMTNTKAAVDWALSQGANALETDIRFNNDGNPTTVSHGSPCDCICALTNDHICKALDGDQCDGSAGSNDAVNHLQYIATLNTVALLYIDSKVDPAWGSRLKKAGEAIIPFVDSNLMAKGFQGKVLISAAKIASYDYIQAAVLTATNSAYKDRYFFTFDEEGNEYYDVISMLSRLTTNRIYSTGTSGCLPKVFNSALTASIAGRTTSENGLTIIWTVDLDSSMEDYINMGVHGILTNRVAALKNVANSMGLTLANPSSSIPISTKNLSSPNKCSCEYKNGGCSISFPAPLKAACQCIKFPLLPWCIGSVVSCDQSQAKCIQSDASKEACQLGKGNCAGYIA
ncbi:hypothetical protein I4U23_017227 [Adineta vaga]|nr:hypothetical protein I4U23_017227 [Adineta vaga]